MRLSYSVIFCLSLTGCASSLEIFENGQGSPTRVAGVPFRAPELYVREGIYKQASKGGICDQAPFIETEVLPLGPLYYANFKSAEFAKSEFGIKFNDKGSVSEISMKSEPAAGDALKNVGELIKAVAPLAAGAASAPLRGPNPACDAGPTSVKYTRLSDWQAAHP